MYDPQSDEMLLPPTPTDRARRRFTSVMARHFRETDVDLSDDALVRAVLARYEKARREPIIDVNE